MRFDRRVVVQTPLRELWDERGVVSRRELRDLNAADIAEMLRAGGVRFVTAVAGSPLKWAPVEECFTYWKSEVKGHVADPASKNYPGDFPGEYCYFASEWESGDGRPIVLLTVSH